MDAFRKIRGFAAPGRIFRVLQLLLLASVLAVGPTPAARAQDQERLDASSWRQLLREHTDDFAAARLRHREAQRALAGGDRQLARTLLRESAALDPRFEDAHSELAKVELLSGKPAAIGEVLDSAIDRTTGFRNQSRTLANAVVFIDAVIGAMLVWCVLVLLVRYLPYLHHRLARQVLDDNHRSRRARLLWPAVIAPFVAMASWGIVPLLALSVPVIWIHSDRRPRVLIGLLLGFFILQGVWTRPVETLMTGTNPGSRASLVERAAYEPPTDALLARLDEAIEKNPGDADLLGAKGLLLARRGDFEWSTEALLENLELRPDDAIAMNNLAATHFFRGDIDRAVAGFQRTVAIDSTRPTPYYNLSQAFLLKLFMKEGGDALQQALRRDFAVTEQIEQLPRGAVYFMRPRVSETWRLAWSDPGGVGPASLLREHSSWLGVPSHHLRHWLIAIAMVSVLAGLAFPRKRLVFECANCGTLACRHCRGEHEGAVLCTDCGSTARRAKSEVVLTTLLRNRKRDTEAAYHTRLRKLDQMLPGAGRLVDGVQQRGVFSALLVALSFVLVVLGRLPLADPWTEASQGWITVGRIAGVLVLGIAMILNNIERPTPRNRHLQPHPSSTVSLAGLIEGRPPTRAKAGV